MRERVHPARPDWYEKLYATAMDKGMKSYEAEVAQYKAKLFSQLTAAGKNILELGVGMGPNFRYYASADGVSVVGVDPNRQMEEYARAAAISAGLPPSNFTFRKGVGEALPVEDNSMDAVIGTLVLCSVKDTDMALRDVVQVWLQTNKAVYLLRQYLYSNLHDRLSNALSSVKLRRNGLLFRLGISSAGRAQSLHHLYSLFWYLLNSVCLVSIYEAWGFVFFYFKKKKKNLSEEVCSHRK